MRQVISLGVMLGTALLLGGCVVIDRINFGYMPAPVSEHAKRLLYPVTVTVVDGRPYVLSGDKPPYFVGVFKNTFGVPYDARTQDDIFIADDIRHDLIKDLRQAGFTIMESGFERRIVVTIYEYNFNCYRDCRVWHNLQLKITDAFGTELYAKSIKDDRDVIHNNPLRGPQSTMQKEMPIIYARMIRSLVCADAEAMAALGQN